MIYPLDCYLHSAKCSTHDGPAYYNGAQCLPYHTYAYVHFFLIKKNNNYQFDPFLEASYRPIA